MYPSISEEIRRNISDKGIEAEIIEAGEMRISHCIGCNFCWLKTPVISFAVGFSIMMALDVALG